MDTQVLNAKEELGAPTPNTTPQQGIESGHTHANNFLADTAMSQLVDLDGMVVPNLHVRDSKLPGTPLKLQNGKS